LHKWDQQQFQPQAVDKAKKLKSLLQQEPSLLLPTVLPLTFFLLLVAAVVVGFKLALHQQVAVAVEELFSAQSQLRQEQLILSP
jgi:uncharacterized membrane protein (DUF106 family)